MRIFVFLSQSREGLHAFAGDIAGSRLPVRVGPWRLIAGSPPGGALPHGIPRRMIERAIGATGFQLWRLRATPAEKADSEAAASTAPEPTDARPARKRRVPARA